MSANATANDVQAVDALAQSYERLRGEIGKVIVGQDDVVRFVLLSIFCDGHSLLVGVPGLAKTLLIQTISDVLHLSFKRIQFTPDLMPSDIIGSEMLDEQRRFRFNPGPLFANIILADEINRTPPKTQAALLEAMQERGVTAAGHRHPLPLPFFVLATQNPIEQEGTYPLPEAQMDRFLMHVYISYPDDAAEKEVIRLVRGETAAAGKPGGGASAPIPQSAIFEARDEIAAVQISEPMEDYIVALVASTRRPAEFSEDLAKYIQVGVSPRGSLALDKVSRAQAWLQGRDQVTPDDIRAVINDCLRHRIIPSFEAQADGVTTDDIIAMVVKLVAVA